MDFCLPAFPKRGANPSIHDRSRNEWATVGITKSFLATWNFHICFRLFFVVRKGQDFVWKKTGPKGTRACYIEVIKLPIVSDQRIGIYGYFVEGVAMICSQKVAFPKKLCQCHINVCCYIVSITFHHLTYLRCKNCVADFSCRLDLPWVESRQGEPFTDAMVDVVVVLSNLEGFCCAQDVDNFNERMMNHWSIVSPESARETARLKSQYSYESIK